MSGDGTAERLPFGAGTVAGAMAWLLTYIATYVVTGDVFTDRVFGSGTSVPVEYLVSGSEVPGYVSQQFHNVPVWKSVGWVFYNAHLVPTVVANPNVDVSGSFVGGEGFTALLYPLPALLILGAGYVLARSLGAGTLRRVDAAAVGATVTVGYLALSLVGLYVFVHGDVRPAVVRGVALAGVGFPLLFGVAGGLVARQTGGG